MPERTTGIDVSAYSLDMKRILLMLCAIVMAFGMASAQKVYSPTECKALYTKIKKHKEKTASDDAAIISNALGLTAFLDYKVGEMLNADPDKYQQMFLEVAATDEYKYLSTFISYLRSRNRLGRLESSNVAAYKELMEEYDKMQERAKPISEALR